MENILDLGIRVSNVEQIINMGGPYICDLLINEELITQNCIANNFVYNNLSKLLYFVKYHVESKYHWYFTINFYNLINKSVFESDKQFDMVFLKQVMGEDKLEAFHAFHGEFMNKKFVFDLNRESFKQV